MASKTLETITSGMEQTRRQLVDSYVRQARTVWENLTPSDWWNDAMTYTAAARLAILELALIEQVRKLGISYADETLKLVGVKPQGDAGSLVYPRANTDAWLTAARPAESYRDMAVESPSIRPEKWPDRTSRDYETVNRWRESAYRRLATTVDEDVQRTMSSAALNRYRNSKVLEYRRVIHPELSKTGSCGLCVIAADRWYSTANLMPLHANCHCGVAPAGSDYDPGLQLNRKDLQGLYDTAGGRTAAELRNVKVMSYDHGELGPMLCVEDVKQRDVSNANWNAPDRRMTLEQFQRMENRAIEFGRQLKNAETAKGEIKFRVAGESKTFRFRNSGNLKQAMAWNRTMLNQMRAQLGKAA